jgi:hypothetical protein
MGFFKYSHVGVFLCAHKIENQRLLHKLARVMKNRQGSVDFFFATRLVKRWIQIVGVVGCCILLSVIQT